MPEEIKPEREPQRWPDKKSVPLPYVVGDSYNAADGRICKLFAENDWRWVEEPVKE